MSEPMTISQMARLGGYARARKLSKERLSEIARRASNARWARFREGKRRRNGCSKRAT